MSDSDRKGIREEVREFRRRENNIERLNQKIAVEQQALKGNLDRLNVLVPLASSIVIRFGSKTVILTRPFSGVQISDAAVA